MSHIDSLCALARDVQALINERDSLLAAQEKLTVRLALLQLSRGPLPSLTNAISTAALRPCEARIVAAAKDGFLRHDDRGEVFIHDAGGAVSLNLEVLCLL